MSKWTTRLALVSVLASACAHAHGGGTSLYLFHPHEAEQWPDDVMLARTVNPSPEQRLQPWPAHRIMDSVYYVGTQNLGSFLIATPDGHILVNTTYEETLPLVRASVEDLGYQWRDIRIVLGSHAHSDHMSGNALMKEETGAEFVAMADDVPLLEAMTPGGKPHPIDRVINHGNAVELGGVVLTAHLTGGHTPGATTWTFEAADDGQVYQVVILGAAIATGNTDLTSPDVQDQFEHAFRVQRSLQCDVPLGPHTPMYNMEEKYARLVAQGGGGPNPFVDPRGCLEEIYQNERIYYLRLRETLRRVVSER